MSFLLCESSDVLCFVLKPVFFCGKYYRSVARAGWVITSLVARCIFHAQVCKWWWWCHYRDIPTLVAVSDCVGLLVFDPRYRCKVGLCVCIYLLRLRVRSND